MAGDVVTAPPRLGWTQYDIDGRSVLPDEIKVDGREIFQRFSRVANQSDGFQKGGEKSGET